MAKYKNGVEQVEWTPRLVVTFVLGTALGVAGIVLWAWKLAALSHGDEVAPVWYAVPCILWAAAVPNLLLAARELMR